MSNPKTTDQPQQRLSYDECMDLFEGSMPIAAVNLLLDPELDVAWVRDRLTLMAKEWNAASPEAKARRASPALEAAMDAYWRTYHTESQEPWQCVQAALWAVRGML